MNRFIIINELPFLYADGKAYRVRWDANGFTVGAEVELASAPSAVFSELSIKAKCAVLDSIGAATVDIDSMNLAELKEYAKAQGIRLNGARTIDSIKESILSADGQAVTA